MDTRRQVDLVTGRSFSHSPSTNSYFQTQIMPYSQPHGDIGNSVKQPKPKLSKSWSIDDPELKRRRRVASYKVYTVEGRVKTSFRKSFRWLKTKYMEMRYGWW